MVNGSRSSAKLATRFLAAADGSSIPELAQQLKQGRLVAFPTDTVYGVGADAFNEAAIRQLFQVKQRPFAKGIPLLLADWDDLESAARHVPPLARALITRFWPGPLTLVVPRHPDLPPVLAPGDTIAVRMPDHTVARALIRAAGGLLAVTSANLSGQPPATDGRQALAALGGLITAVLDDGPSPQAQSSTVIDCTGPTPQILRPGPITAADLQLETPHAGTQHDD